MGRASRRKAAPTNAATDTGQGSLVGTTSEAAKPPKKRRSLKDREAALERELVAVRKQQKLEAIAANKPLAAAYKAIKRLQHWLREETYLQVEHEIDMVIAGTATWLEGSGEAPSEEPEAEEGDETVDNDRDDGDAS